MFLPGLAVVHLSDIGNIAAAVVAVATVALFIAAIFAGKTAKAQIEEQRKIARRRRAYDHLGVFNSRHFTETSGEAQRIFRQFEDDAVDKKTMWEGVSDSEKAAVQTVLNFYEETANEYNAGFLDHEVAEPLVFVTCFMWEQAREAVEWLRHGERRYLDQWEALYDAHSSVLSRPAETSQ